MDEASAHSAKTPPEASGAMAEFSDGRLTQILADLRHGDMEARGRLVALVYEDLRSLASIQLRGERVAHTLQPTALVHEAFLRLFGSSGSAWNNRAHFFAAAGEAMRRILVDYARQRLAQKRGGGAERVDIDSGEIAKDLSSDTEAVTVLAINEALEGLAEHDERKCKLVELRFFAGLTLEETAHALGVSLATAKRDWAFAKAWLTATLDA